MSCGQYDQDFSLYKVPVSTRTGAFHLKPISEKLGNCVKMWIKTEHPDLQVHFQPYIQLNTAQTQDMSCSTFPWKTFDQQTL